MDKKNKKREDRPIAYPLPSQSDRQLKDQPEYIDQEPNEFHKEISDLPGNDKENKERKEGG
jgi:hypothetical protein